MNTMNINERPSADFEIDIKHYVFVLRSRLWLLALMLVGAAVAAFVVSRLSTPVYRATTWLLIDAQTDSGNGTADYAAIRASESLAQTYASLLQSRTVLTAASERLDLANRPNASFGSVQTSPVTGTQLIRVSADNSSPALAAEVANTVASVFIEQNYQRQTSAYSQSQDSLSRQLDYLETQINQTTVDLNALQGQQGVAEAAERARLEDLLAQYNQNYTSLLQSIESVRLAAIQSTSNIVQVDPAVMPSRPLRPNVMLNTIVAGALGLLAGVILVLIEDFLDDTVKNPDTVSQQLRLPIIGMVLNFDAERERLITVLKPRSPAAESYRRIRINIKYASVDHDLHTLLITSPAPSEGKTTLAANLGVVLATNNQSTILIDGDLRRPNVHKALGLSNRRGLSDLFIESADTLEDVIQDSGVEGLSVITSGPLPPNPSELLDSAKIGHILEEVRQHADLVIIDAPPAISLTDAVALSQRVDGVVLVLRAGRTKMALLRQAVQDLRQVGANVIGLIFTDIDHAGNRYGQYYYYYKSYNGYYETEDGEANGSSGRKRLDIFGRRNGVSQPEAVAEK